MRFIDDQRVVLPQAVITMRFRKQNPVGHHLDESTVVGMIVEADLVSDRMGAGLFQLMCQPCCQTARCNAAWLRAADHAMHAASEFETNFWKLGGLAGASFTAEDHDLMFFDECGYFCASFGNRQGVVECRFGDERVPLLADLKTIVSL